MIAVGGGVVAVVVKKVVRVEEMLGHAHDNNNDYCNTSKEEHLKRLVIGRRLMRW